KAKGHASHGEGRAMDFYMKVLNWTLYNRWWTVLIGVVAFAITIFLFKTLPFTFQPPLNVDTSRVSIQMVPGTTLEQTENVADRVAAILKKEPEVATALEYID